jgi:uncharacterized small protein (DUF1192 family)
MSLTPDMMPAWELREHLKDRDDSIVTLGNEITRLTAENERLRSQLPEGMEHCKILFEECPVGHGHLRGDNWIKHECGQCRNVALTAEVERLRAALGAMVHALCGHTGFAAAVRHDSNKAYPWPALDNAEALARAALTQEKSDDK